MISDEERREVSTRLRELKKSTEYDYSTVWGSVLDPILGTEPPASERYGWNYTFDRLADLIEPSIPADPGEAGLASVDGFIKMRHSTKEEQDEYSAMLEKMSVELHPVDRDALLALADELENDGLDHYIVSTQYVLDDYARRIREALGGYRR